MGAAAVARALGALMIALAGFTAPAWILAWAIDDRAAFPRLGVVVAASLFLGLGLVAAVSGARVRANAIAGLWTAVIGWSVLPFLAAPGFLGAPGVTGLGDAVFEATAALTTTGASVIPTDQSLSPALALWRACLCAFGGMAAVCGALILLSAVNLSGPGVHRTAFFTFDPDTFFNQAAKATGAVAIVFAVILSLTFLALWASGNSALAAFERACYALSTAGYAPSQSDDFALNPLTTAALTFALLAGASNFALHWDFLQGRPWGLYPADPETRALVVIVAVFVGWLIWLGEPLAPALVEGAGLAATAVVDVSPRGLEAAPPALVLGAVIVGGAAVSTAGGFKLARVLLLLRRASRELDRLAHPAAVLGVGFRGRSLSTDDMVPLWLYFIGYAAALAGLTLALSATGADFDRAVGGAAAAISNAGPALTVAVGDPDAYLGFNASGRWVLVLGMILGRIEVLAAIAALSPTARRW